MIVNLGEDIGFGSPSRFSMGKVLVVVLVIVAGLGTVFGIGFINRENSPPASTSFSPPPPASPAPLSPSSSSTQQFVCGTQLPGVALFGSWRWFGVVSEASDSGVITFKSDCTYTIVLTSGSTTTSEGRFNVSG